MRTAASRLKAFCQYHPVPTARTHFQEKGALVMLRKVAGGLMCLAVIALGVALLRGQEAGKNPKPGDSGSETVPNVPAGAADEGTLPIDPNLVGFDVFAGDGAIAGGELDQNNVIVEIGDDGS